MVHQAMSITSTSFLGGSTLANQLVVGNLVDQASDDEPFSVLQGFAGTGQSTDSSLADISSTLAAQEGVVNNLVLSQTDNVLPLNVLQGFAAAGLIGNALSILQGSAATGQIVDILA